MSSIFNIDLNSGQLSNTKMSVTTPNNEVALHGLIEKKGRNNTSYFTSSLDFKKALQMLKKDKYLLEAIEADRMLEESSDQISSYLKASYKLAETFQLSDTVCSRQQLMIDIDARVREKGRMNLLTGGPSVGKSMLLNRLRSDLMDTNDGTEKPFMVLYVDGRISTESLLADLMNEISLIIPKSDKLKALVRPGYPTAVVRLSELMLPTTDSKENISKAAELLTKLSEVSSIVIIIDEANAYFRKSSESSADLLQMFIALTKQRHIVNVLLSTSEFSFPYTLQSEMGFKMGFLRSTMVLGEVLPDDMYNLLTAVFKLRHNLALRLIDLFGGHIDLVITVLCDLQSNYTDLVPKELFPGGGISNVEKCLSDSENDKEARRHHMIEALQSLATVGFVSMKYGDIIGRILTENNVAGYVGPTACTYGINRAFKGGMVPFTQTCRLDILQVLSDNDLII